MKKAPQPKLSPYMNGRLLDENNDIYLDENGHVARASSLKQRAMRLIGTVLRTVQGECFTDYEAGVPWFSNVLGKSVLFADKEKVLGIEGVASVDDMMVQIDGRNMSGKYKVTLDNGESVKGNF